MKQEILNTIENKLKEIHARDYHGLDDDMPEAFEHWILELSTDPDFEEIIKLIS